MTQYRIYLESRRLAPGTINLRLAAVRRLAYEAAESGLLSPELAAGIRRVKGSKKLGVRLGNWLTAEKARALWQLPSAETIKGKRDRAILYQYYVLEESKEQICIKLDLSPMHFNRVLFRAKQRLQKLLLGNSQIDVEIAS